MARSTWALALPLLVALRATGCNAQGSCTASFNQMTSTASDVTLWPNAYSVTVGNPATPLNIGTQSDIVTIMGAPTNVMGLFSAGSSTGVGPGLTGIALTDTVYAEGGTYAPVLDAGAAQVKIAGRYNICYAIQCSSSSAYTMPTALFFTSAAATGYATQKALATSSAPIWNTVCTYVQLEHNERIALIVSPSIAVTVCNSNPCTISVEL